MGLEFTQRRAVEILGRSTTDVKAHVNLTYRHVSRLHMFLCANRTAIDMRSLHGTTVNGERLMYGDSRSMEPGDIFVLASIGTSQFHPFAYGEFQLFPPTLSFSKVPEAWAVLLDAGAKAVHYLSEDRYLVALDGEQRLIVSEAPDDGNDGVEGPLMIVQRHPGEDQYRFDDAFGRSEAVDPVWSKKFNLLNCRGALLHKCPKEHVHFA